MIPSQNIKEESFGIDNSGFRLTSSNPFAAGILDQSTFPEDQMRVIREQNCQPVKVSSRHIKYILPQIDVVIINASTNEKESFKDEMLERDQNGNIMLVAFIQKIVGFGFGNIKGCALSVYSHYEDTYIFIGQEGQTDFVKS